MAVYTEPIESQPEFDDHSPLTGEDRALLRIIRPVIGIYHLFAMPVHMYRRHRRPRGNSARPASPTDWNLPPAERVYLEDTERALSSLGFGHARREVALVSSTTRAYFIHLFNTETRDLATVIVGIIPRRWTQTLVGFRTWWEDGRQTITSNNDQAELRASLHRPRHLDVLTLPGVEDVGRLYSVHRARCAERNGHVPLGSGWDDPVHNPTELLRRTFDEMDRRLVESGLFRVESDEFLRLTMKGAILISWSRLQPFEWYLGWRGRRRTAAALRRYSGS
jgi:hypothetical protein